MGRGAGQLDAMGSARELAVLGGSRSQTVVVGAPCRGGMSTWRSADRGRGSQKPLGHLIQQGQGDLGVTQLSACLGTPTPHFLASSHVGGPGKPLHKI